MRLGTMVTPLAQRRPWKVARELVTLDHLSQGRVVLGVGMGDIVNKDFKAFGEPGNAQVRAEMLDESLVMHRCGQRCWMKAWKLSAVCKAASHSNNAVSITR
jgi:alkanesulfonate monooxygenase SsuD/methylene tetrahydromethanopterin reductase-like flavin-dependent oxidoreductase (luciferase family)